MEATLLAVRDTWQWDSAWGWDVPVMAMTATRVGRPDLAVDSLLMDGQKNQSTGHCPQMGSFLPVYLPANGGLLAAVSLMAAGWDGADTDLPGLPRDGSWTARHDGFSPGPDRGPRNAMVGVACPRYPPVQPPRHGRVRPRRPPPTRPPHAGSARDNPTGLDRPPAGCLRKRDLSAPPLISTQQTGGGRRAEADCGHGGLEGIPRPALDGPGLGEVPRRFGGHDPSASATIYARANATQGRRSSPAMPPTASNRAATVATTSAAMTAAGDEGPVHQHPTG
jgi:hypothetical protein